MTGSKLVILQMRKLRPGKREFIYSCSLAVLVPSFCRRGSVACGHGLWSGGVEGGGSRRVLESSHLPGEI